MTTGSRTEGLRGIGSEGFIRTVKNLTVTGDLVVHGETRSTVGTGHDVSAYWETADANANYWAYDLPAGGAVAVPVMGVGIGLKDVDLGLFDGLTQPTFAVLDADRDSYLVLDFSADDSPRIRSNQDITFSGNVIFGDNITVNGTTTTVSSSVVVIDDPLFHLGNDNNADAVDLGIFAEYTDSGKKFSGLFRDASDSDQWKLFATTGNSHEEPSTTVNTTSGFTLANLAVNELEGTLTTVSQTNITGVGTITTGVWTGTTIATANGGTGATTLNNLITMGTHTTGNYVATITGGTGIDSDAATSGESTGHTLSIDLAEVGEVAIADGDYIAFMDATDSNATKKEALADLVGLMAGTVTSTGISDSSSVLSVDIQNLTATTAVDDADLVMIDDGAGGTLRKMTRAHLIESAALDAINIDGGAIDAVTLGTNSAVTEAQIDNINIDGSTIAASATAHDTAGTSVIISGGDTTAGTTNNIAGGDLTIQGGQGKGSGAGGDIIFQTANAGGSGSAVNSLATALTISDDLSSTFAGGVTIDGDLAFTGPQEITTSSGTLSLKATTDTDIVRPGDGVVLNVTRNSVASWAFYVGNTALGTGVAGTGSLELQPNVGNVEFAILPAGVSPLPKFVVNPSTGVTQIGGTADHGTTVGTNFLSIFNGAAPVGTLLNGISLYSASGELNVIDAAGNTTLLSPHDSAGRWVFDSKDVEGKRLVIHMEKFMKALEAHFGWGFVEEFIEEV